MVEIGVRSQRLELGKMARVAESFYTWGGEEGVKWEKAEKERANKMMHSTVT